MTEQTGNRFQVHSHPFGNHAQYKLQDNLTGESISILPHCGGLLNSFKYLAGSSLIELIDGYKTVDDLKLNLELSFKGINLFPFPNRLAKGQYRLEDRQYQLPLNMPHEQNSIHGLVYDKPFDIIHTRGGDHSCSMEIGFEANGSIPGYPFHYSLSHTFIFEAPCSFHCTTTVHNKSGVTIPVGHGWHPYFSMGDDTIDGLLLSFPANKILEVNTVNIPTGNSAPYNSFTSSQVLGKTVLDNCFQLKTVEERAEIFLRNSQQDIGLKIWQETGTGKYNFLQVYTPPHRNSIAIEPMTCAPDSFNNGIGLIQLPPHSSTSWSFGIAAM